jgi:lycopene cyclase domain-containing protein
MTYTAAAVLGVGFAAALDLLVLRTRLLRRRAFWTAYAIVVFFQLVVNGVLTGERLVVYAPGAILGDATPHFLGHWRVAYAPVEDLIFGFSLVLQAQAWWVWWGRRAAVSATSDGRATPARGRGRPPPPAAADPR